MKTAVIKEPEQELLELCRQARQLINHREYTSCFQLISRSMASFPDAAQPHNLLGILFEMQGDHPSAMRHFRAAYALDPGYLPARENLETYGTFYSGGRTAYGDEC